MCGAGFSSGWKRRNLASEAEFDEIVMMLVETALGKPAGERETYLQQVCRGDEKLFKEVTERIDWELRMGHFLREPLLKLRDGEGEVSLPKRSAAPWVALALVLLVALLAASMYFGQKQGSTDVLAAEAAEQMKKFDNGEGRQWLDAAGATVSKAIAADPKSVAILILSGDYQLRYGFPELAAKQYGLALEIDPANVAAKARLEKLRKN